MMRVKLMSEMRRDIKSGDSLWKIESYYRHSSMERSNNYNEYILWDVLEIFTFVKFV